MILIGLGNPGAKFENTPHNIGFKIIDFFAKENNFPDFKLQKKAEVLISEKEGVLLAKPQTFMNESGRAVKKIVKSYKSQITSLIVVHDDVDLPIGKIKIAKDRGSAGHKGVESVIKAIGNENFTRIRIGVSPIEAKPKEAEKYVLKKFDFPQETIKKAAEAILILKEKGLEAAMNQLNQ